MHVDGLRKQGCTHLVALLEPMMALLLPWMAAQGLDVGGRPTCQLGLYPGGGACYVRHADRHPLTGPYRTATAIVYVNPGWDSARTLAGSCASMPTSKAQRRPWLRESRHCGVCWSWACRRR